MGRNLGRAVPFGVELGPHLTQCARAEAYHRTKWDLDPPSRLATTNMGLKLGACAPFLGDGELDPHLALCGLGRGLLHTKCHLDPCSRLATIDMGRKLGVCPYFVGGSWVPM